jgi:hypothetical protein
MNSPRSKASICSILVLFSSTLLILAQNSAFDSMEAFGKSRGKTDLKQVVGLTGSLGQDQPRQWLVLMKDTKIPNLMHEYAVEKGKIVGERHFSPDPDQNLPSVPLPLAQLNFDSADAFRIATQAAVKGGIGFDSVNYLLRIHSTNPSPVWTLTLLDQQKNTVGIVFVSVSTGKLAGTKWYRPGSQEYIEVNSTSASDEIKDIWNRGVSTVSRGIQKLDKKIEKKLGRDKPTIDPAN